MSTYALHATAKFFDQTVEETFAPRGEPLDFGANGPLALPLPDENAVFASARWVSGASVRVIDPLGGEHLLEPEGEVRLRGGPIEIEFRLVKQGVLRRFVAPSIAMSLGWFVAVLGSTVAASSASTAAEVIEPHTCEILNKMAPLHPRFEAWFTSACTPKHADGSGGIYIAEYLQRLLREDYAGADEGQLEVHQPDLAKKENSYYLPAGAPGPATEMGGAAEASPTPVRSQGFEDPASVAASQGKKIHVTPLLSARPVAQAVDVGDDKDQQGMTDQGKEKPDEDAVESPPAEEKVGWGVRDWYDAADERLDNREIRTMLNVARQRLRIDPTDPDALGVLSYYQYLAQDFVAAAKTYDKYIALYPDSSAGYNNKALIYKRTGEYDKEENLYQLALSLSPDDVTALNNLAVNYAHQRRFDEAMAVMKRLETLDPDDAYADLHRAKIYAAMGNDETSMFYLQKSLEGMRALDTLHHIEFRQDIRLDPTFEALRKTVPFRDLLVRYYGKDTPMQE